MTISEALHAPACSRLPNEWHTLLHTWESAALRPHRNPYSWKTRNHVYRIIRTLLDHGAELTTWRDIRPEHVSNYADLREAQQISPETTRKELTALTSFIRFCECRDPHSQRISHLLKGLRPPCRQTDPQALTQVQERDLLEHAQRITAHASGFGTVRDWYTGAFHLLCSLGITMGLRPTELLWLHWQDFELDTARPVLRLTTKPQWRLKTPLAATPLLIPPELAQRLRSHRFTMMKFGRPRTYLFARVNGPHLAPPHYDDIWKHLAVICHAPGLNCLWLRRTCATRLTERGWSIEAVRNWMRHASYRTCERYYVARSQGIPLDYNTGFKEGLQPQRQLGLW